MAERRPFNRNNRAPRPNQPARNRSDSFERESIEENVALDPTPRNNHRLQNEFDKTRFPETGMTVDRLSAEGGKIRLEIDPDAETFRLNERSTGPELPTMASLAEQSVIDESTEKRRAIEGELPAQLATALIVRDRDGAERVAVFERPQLESFGRNKKSGATGLLNDLPSRQALSEIRQEYFMFGRTKIGNQKVIVAVDNGQPEEIQAMQIRRGMQRIEAPLQAKVQSVLTQPGFKADEAYKAHSAAAEFMKEYPIVFLKKQSVGKDLAEHLVTVETEIGTDKEETKGLVHYVAESRQATVIVPVVVSPEAHGIDMDSLTYYDAAGEERALGFVDEPDGTQAEHIKIMASHLGQPERVQKQPQGPVVLPPSIEAQMVHNPHTVLPPSALKAA
jgi:hypothetical protein